MKKRLSRVSCFALVLIMLVGMIPATSPRVHAASQSQMNAVARADYMYNATWVCQQTVAGWGDTFYAGNTYHIPYGQPINSGKYVGYAASVDEFLEAAATPGSVFYTGRSYYTGTTAPYYVTDCSSFVSWCWGISRTTTYYIPSVSTKIGAATTHNCTYNLQLGDALNHPDHVVMVTGLSYDAGGAISQIEITEQTPPQMKRSYYTPSQLADKYSAYTIYRYYGEVPAAPNTTVLEGWQFIDGNWYYYVGNARTTGWLNDNGTWYYLDASGIMQTGWLKIDGYWYYFKPVNGMMQTGWIYVDGCWYYMDKESGRMRTGWVYDENTWYYLNPANGVMQTGWITVDGATYYLNPDGGMVTGNQTISGIPYQFSSSGALILGTYPGGMAGDGVIYAEGVDISYWNGENCNLQAVKDAGFDYVIIRAGSTNLGQDVYFETFYNRARAVGLDIGVYFYSYATTVEGAIADANKCLSFIAGKTFEYPIYFDYEDPCQDNLDQSLQTQICLAFMDTLSASGYVTGLCSYAAKIAGMDMDTIGAKYECWIANYVDDWHTTKDPEYSSKYGMYQYSNEKYAGSVGPFDADVSYKDYPSIMKRYGLNGYTKETEDVTCNHETHDIYGNCYMCDQYVGHSYANGVCTGCDLRCSHSYTDGVCMVCGGVEPGFAPTLTGKSFSLSFEDEILVNFYYTISDMANVTEHGMLVFYEDPGSADYSQADAVYTDSVYDAVKNRYMNTTDGVAAKEMGDGRFYAAYARLSDGSYVYSSLYNYSPQKYAMNMLGKSSTSESQKALCVAMLNYGAAAQTYFGYKPDSLMNTSLTDAQRGLAVPYSADLLKGAVAADNSKAGSFAKTASGFSKKSVSVSFDGAFGVNYYFAASNVPEGEMTFYYWTAEDYAAVQTLTAHSATGTVGMEIAENGSYWAMVDGIAAKEIDDTIYVAGVYSANGETYCTGIVAYSLSTYFKKIAAGNSDMQPLATAAAVYGYYAKAYFA